MRRVITGQTPEGKNVFTHVEDVAPLQLGDLRWYGVWGWDEIPGLPHFDPAPYEPRSVYPGPNRGALRVNTVLFPPGMGVPGRANEPGEGFAQPSQEYLRLLSAEPAGGFHDHATGMHCTDSIEIGFALSGEICLEQDDGAEVTLRPGDVYVQNGAVHAWRNRSEEPCLFCFVVIGTTRDEDRSQRLMP